MAPKATKRTKASGRNKKLAGGKRMNEVKPLAYDAFLKLDGITGESQKSG
jgi:hypothetical protein